MGYRSVVASCISSSGPARSSVRTRRGERPQTSISLASLHFFALLLLLVRADELSSAFESISPSERRLEGRASESASLMSIKSGSCEGTKEVSNSRNASLSSSTHLPIRRSTVEGVVGELGRCLPLALLVEARDVGRLWRFEDRQTRRRSSLGERSRRR
ncbi:hypothetical protein AAT19DRAFT_15431 [Rhodotorula toruloides]|uniref:Uncharacterized protein n=1 Tax=Rhodotorula toruloides TaxID=5286 RepID=A0A2T0A765_RHOTO|nr:hypothetical protein AAT19DRAFT_15431 [Rhodotorula toruloides]